MPAADIPVVLIGASTGGPAAIKLILSELPEDLPAAIVIAQHMPEKFTGIFADRLNGMSGFEVAEVAGKARLEPRHCYIARGGADCVLYKRGRLAYAHRVAPLEGTAWRPSIDRLAASAVNVVRPQRLVAVLLTGMGNDGAEGMHRLQDYGAAVLVQSPRTCVVSGMPSSLIARTREAAVLDLRKIPGAIRRHFAMAADGPADG